MKIGSTAHAWPKIDNRHFTRGLKSAAKVVRKFAKRLLAIEAARKAPMIGEGI